MESDTPAENCIFNPTCFCLMDSLAGLQGGGGGGGGGSPTALRQETRGRGHKGVDQLTGVSDNFSPSVISNNLEA